MADRVRVEIVGDSSSLVAASNRAERAIRGVGNETRSQTKAATAFNAAGQKQAKTTGVMGSSAVVAAKSWAKFGAATAAAAVAGAAIRKIAGDTMDFDAAMRNVNSIAQLNEKQFESLKDRVLSLAGPTAQAPQTLAEGMYDLVSSGFKANQSIQILRASALAATAGLTDTATSTKAVAAVLNAYHRPASDAAAVSDVLFRTVDRGVITFGDLANEIGGVLPFAAGAEISLKEVGAVIATLTKGGQSGANAITFFKNAIVAFNKPSTDLTKAIRETGFASGEALIKAKGFEGALQAVTATTDGSQASIQKLFGNVRASAAVLGLVGKNSQMASTDLKGFADAGGATAEALSQQSKSISYQWNKLKAEASVLSIRVGFAFIKVVKDIVHAKGQIGKSVHDIDVFLGPIIGGILNGVKRMFQGMLKSIGSTMKLIGDLLHGRWSKIWADIRGIFQGFFRWLGGVGKLMLTPLIAAAKLVDHGLTSAFGGMWTGIKGVFVDGANAVISVMNSLLDILDKVPFVDVGNIGALGGGGPPKGSTRHPHPGRGPHFADGGLIDGSGNRDTVPIMAAPGEAILNRHQQAPVETALRSTFGFGLGELFRRESTPHYMATGGFADAQHFDIGGFIGNAIDTVAGAGKRVLQNTVGAGLGGGAKWLAGQIGSAPPPFGPFPMWAATKASDWLTGEAQAYGKKHQAPSLGGVKGPKGIGTYAGMPMANWVIESLKYAAGKGVAPAPTSGYRSHAYNVSQGRNYFSEHEGTQYPHGAVDFGGYTTGLAAKMSVVRATSDFKYPLLAPIGFVDDGHASGTGHARGGFVRALANAGGDVRQRFAKGGFSSPITVKHSGASASQTATAGASLKAADKTRAEHKARVALIMAATQESNMSPHNTYQLTSDFGPVDPGSGTFAQAVYWLTKGYWGKGGGIALAKHVKDPGAIAQMVEGSAYPSYYSPWKSEAQHTVDSWSGRGGGGGGDGKPKDTGPTKAEIAARRRKRRANARVKQRAETLKGLRQNLGLGLEGASKAPQLTALARFWHLFGDFADKKPRWTALEKRLDNARTEKARLMTLREMRRVTRGFDEANISGHSTESLKEERGPLPGYDTPLDRKQMKAEREKKLRGLRYRLANADNPKRKLAAFEALRDFWATYGVFGDTFKPHAAGGGVGPGRAHDSGATVQHYKRAAYDPKLTGAKHLAAVKKWDTWAARHGEISGAPEDKLKGRIPKFGKDKGPNWEEIARLRGELLLQARQSLLASQAEFGVFKGLPGALGGPYLGAFAQGGKVPHTGMALVHRDEVIVPDPDGPYGRLGQRDTAAAGPTTVNLYVDGDAGPMVKRMRAEIDGRAAKVVDKQLGRRQRQLAVAPGRA